jgi:membrane dipeptidase
MPALPFPLAKQVGRVPSMTLPLDGKQEARFQNLMEKVVMVDLHEHPMVLPEDMNNLVEYLCVGEYDWGYQAAEHGGWAAVATANCFRGMAKNRELSYISFEDLADEVGMMVAHMGQHKDSVVKVTTAAEILKAKSQGKVGFAPTVEHMALGDQIQRVDTLYALGVRIAGLTYNLQNNIGSGLTERHDVGLSKFGIEVVHRMNELGIAVDVSHAGMQTAMDAIEHSKAPILFSHNAAYTLRPTWRTRKDEELKACAKKGGLVAVTAVPNSLSDDPKQNINVVLDHYDYLVKLLGIDHVAIGTDTLIGDHVAYHKLMLPGMLRKYPVPYLDGLESPADGKNLIRGFILRGYDDAQIKKLSGENALNFLRRTVG